MIKTIEVDFELQEIVYVKTDDKQLERMITSYNVTINGLRYQLNQGSTSDYYYACEISKEKGFLANNKRIGFNKD